MTGVRQAVSAAIVGAALLAGAGAAGGAGDGRVPPGPAPRAVVDARGVLVGLQVGARGVGSLAWRREGGLDVLLDVSRDRIVRGSTDVGFEAEDCQGAPWILSEVTPGASAFFTESGIGPGSVLLVADGSAETRTIASRAAPPGDSPACQALTPVPTVVRPAVPLLDLSVFTPPFRVR
jgi:hypothetical protein